MEQARNFAREVLVEIWIISKRGCNRWILGCCNGKWLHWCLWLGNLPCHHLATIR